MKENIEHVWEYYKVPIFLGLFVLVFLIVGIPSLAATPEPSWNAYYINANVPTETVKEMAVDFQESEWGSESEDDLYVIDNSINFSIETPDSVSYDQMGKFTALIAAKEIDFIVSTEEVTTHYGAFGGFENFEDLLTDEEFEKWSEQIVYIKGEDGEEEPIGIALDGLIGVIPLNSENKETSLDYIRYLLENE